MLENPCPCWKTLIIFIMHIIRIINITMLTIGLMIITAILLLLIILLLLLIIIMHPLGVGEAAVCCDPISARRLAAVAWRNLSKLPPQVHE